VTNGPHSDNAAGLSRRRSDFELRRDTEFSWQHLRERVVVSTLFAAASVATLTTVAIFLTLTYNGWEFFSVVPMREFLLGTDWAPDFIPRSFGSLPLIKGTFQIALGALLVGLPLGVGSALYISEFAPERLRTILKPAIEILAGIPSIVFGLVALFVISPIIRQLFPGTGVFNAASAAIALGVMVVPVIAAISEDALRAVPRELREGAFALGATRWEAAWNVVLPAAGSGVIASVILGFSRAIGETMAVTLAAGLVPNMSWNFLEPTQTITAFIANRAGGDLPTGSIEYRAIFALGLILFVITFVINLIAQFSLAAQRRKFA
jgi:phosphate transport system permease protein